MNVIKMMSTSCCYTSEATNFYLDTGLHGGKLRLKVLLITPCGSNCISNELALPMQVINAITSVAQGRAGQGRAGQGRRGN